MPEPKKDESGKDIPEEELENLDPLAALQIMAAKFAEGIETRLVDSLDKAIEGINAKIDAGAAAAVNLQTEAKVAIEAMPSLIQKHVENQLTANLQGIVENVGAKFEERVKAMAGGGGSGDGAGGGMGIDHLLSHSDKIIGIVNAFRSPTTEQAMMGQINNIFRWHGLLSKLEKGGGSGEDITKAIADTFTQKEG